MKGLRKRIALAAVLLVILTALAGCGQKDRLRIGTAGEGGNYNLLGQALSQTLSKDPYKLNIEAKTTAGSAANIRLLSQNYLELALAQSDVIDSMYHGTLEEQAMKGYSAVAALYPEPVQIVVRAGFRHAEECGADPAGLRADLQYAQSPEYDLRRCHEGAQ